MTSSDHITFFKNRFSSEILIPFPEFLREQDKGKVPAQNTYKVCLIPAPLNIKSIQFAAKPSQVSCELNQEFKTIV